MPKKGHLPEWMQSETMPKAVVTSEESPDVVIVLATCSEEKGSFGIRFEESGRDEWTAMWAFPIGAPGIRKEDYERNSMEGSIYLSPDYPGCPYCKSISFFLCRGCNRIVCWDGEKKKVVCPQCKVHGVIDGVIKHLRGGGDER